MDAERLHSNIRSQLREDPTAEEHIRNQSDPNWTFDPDGLLRHLGHIYVPNTGNLRLCALQYSMIIPLQVISVRRRHFTKSECTITGPDFLFTSKTTASHVSPVPTPNPCATNPTDFSSNFRFLRSLGIPFPWIS